jgi:hypothetical protein
MKKVSCVNGRPFFGFKPYRISFFKVRYFGKDAGFYIPYSSKGLRTARLMYLSSYFIMLPS